MISVIKTEVLFDSTKYYFQRKLARKSNGELWAIYRRSDGAVDQIYVSYSVDEGLNWVEEQITDGVYNQFYPSIAIDSANNVHVAWFGSGWGTYPNNDNIVYRKRTDSWQPPELVTDIEGCQENVSIAVDSANNVHVVWTGIGWGVNLTIENIRYRQRTDSWQAPEAVTDVENTQDYPSIAIDSANNVHVSWVGAGWGGNPDSANIEYCKRTTFWQSPESVSDLADYDASGPSIAVDSVNNVHVAWSSIDFSGWPFNYPISYRKRTDSWQTPEEVATKTALQRYASIAVDAGNNVHVTWVGLEWGVNTGNFNVQYRKRTDSWQAQEGITDLAVDQYHPGLIWAFHPTVTGLKTNRPKTGYAFVWVNDTTIMFYASADLTWDSGVIGLSGICKDKNGVIITGVQCAIDVYNKTDKSIRLASGLSNSIDGSWSIIVPVEIGIKTICLFSYEGTYGGDTDIAGGEFMTTVAI